MTRTRSRYEQFRIIGLLLASGVPVGCSVSADESDGTLASALQTCPAILTLQAATMATKTTGASSCGGSCWEIWSNGYVESTVNFPSSGQYVFDVTARADLALGVGAAMQLRIDQQAVANVTVTATTMTHYRLSANVSAGGHKVAMAFTNDYWNGSTVDRNLYVGQLAIAPSTCGTTPPPPPPPSSSPYPTPILADIITQNTIGKSESTAPVGLEWDTGKIGCSGTCNSPSGFTSLTGWSVIYQDPAFSSTSCNIQVQGFRSYVHLVGGGWRKVQDQNQAGGGVGGAHYIADFSGDANIPWNERLQSDGSVLIDSPPAGYNDHFWANPRPTYTAGTVDGFFDEALMRVDNSNCHLIAELGGDWWRSPTAPYVDGFSNNPAIGEGNWIKLTTSYRYVYFTTFTSSMLQSDPPPLTPPM